MCCYTSFLTAFQYRWGYDKHETELKEACLVTQQLSQIIRERSDLQVVYSRGLNRLSGRLRNVLDAAPSGTVHSAWRQIVDTWDSESELWQRVASELIQGLVQPWTELLDTLSKAQKPLKQNVERVSSQLRRQLSNEVQTRQRFETAYRSWEYAASRHLPTSYIPPLPCNGDISLPMSTANNITSSTLRDHLPDLLLDDRGERHLERVHLKRSATLPSQPASLPAGSMYGGDKIPSSVHKAKSSCLVKLRDYYKASMSTEESRIDWHVQMLESLRDIRGLESQRLIGMTQGLNTYQRLMDDVIPIMQSNATLVKNAVQMADSTQDLMHFRQRAHRNWSPLANDDARNNEAPANESIEPVSGICGCSQQRLLQVPREGELCLGVTAPMELNRSSLTASFTHSNADDAGKATRQRKGRTGNSNSDLVLRACLARECMCAQLDLLAIDVIKERRAKQGLIKLVKVYTHEPVYRDEVTYSMARRRLYMSRVRLTFMTDCRRKLLYTLLCTLRHDGDATGESERMYAESLGNTGFRPLPWFQIATDPQRPDEVAQRWIPLPDLDEADGVGVNQFVEPKEWPPFPDSEAHHEDLNEDLFALRLERLKSLDDEARSHCSVTLNRQRSIQDDLGLRDSQQQSPVRISTLGKSKPLFTSFRRHRITSWTENSAPDASGDHKPIASEAADVDHFTISTSLTQSFTPSVRSSDSDVPIREPAVQPRRPVIPMELRQSFVASPVTVGQQLTCLTEELVATEGTMESTSPKSKNSTLLKHSPKPRRTQSSASPRTKKISSPSAWKFHLFRSRALAQRPSSPSQPNQEANLPKSIAENPQNSVVVDERAVGKPNWNSLASLHCMGWAKVERNYVAQSGDELTLRPGDIVSIYQKENESWWVGELNGFKGRFPVDFVEEF